MERGNRCYVPRIPRIQVAVSRCVYNSRYCYSFLQQTDTQGHKRLNERWMYHQKARIFRAILQATEIASARGDP